MVWCFLIKPIQSLLHQPEIFISVHSSFKPTQSPLKMFATERPDSLNKNIGTPKLNINYTV